jgi:hypothetical protein
MTVIDLSGFDETTVSRWETIASQVVSPANADLEAASDLEAAAREGATATG